MTSPDNPTLARINLLHPKLRAEALAIYQEICAADLSIRITFTLRSVAEQNCLFAQGRGFVKVTGTAEQIAKALATNNNRVAQINAARKAAGLTAIGAKDAATQVTKATGGLSWHNYGLACFSADTLILTDSGFKLFSALDKTEKVAVFKNGKIFYEQPTAYISNDYEGEMVRFKTRSVDLLVTPNHKMVVKRKTNEKWDGKWSTRIAEEIDYKYKLPTGGDFVFPELTPVHPFDCNAETWWEFMGWYLSEGTSCGVSDGVKRNHNGRFKVSISQKNGTTEWHRINRCLQNLGVQFSYSGHEFKIYSKKLWSILFPLGNSYQKRIPRYLLDAPRPLISVLYDALILGDGTHYDKHEVYWSVNRGLTEDVAELMLRLGFAASLQERPANPGQIMPHGQPIQNANVQYAAISRRRNSQELRGSNDKTSAVTKEYYRGVVHCVSTEAGAVVVMRNNKIAVCGNCDIALLLDNKQVSWNESLDLNGDHLKDWQQVTAIFLKHGWEWGGGPAFIKAGIRDAPHFQKRFGLTIRQALARYNAGQLTNGYINL